MIRPTPILALIFALAAVVSLVAVLLTPFGQTVAIFLLAFILIGAAADAVLSQKPKQVSLTQNAPNRIMIGKPAWLDIFADFDRKKPRPKTLCAVDIEGVFRPLDDGSFALDEEGVRIPLSATRRGIGKISAIRLRWFGPLRLIYWQKSLTCDFEIPVVPNTTLVETEGLSFNEREAIVGIKPQRQQGEGTEFEALREFVTGLDPRSIDWKHSARHKELLCKQFEVERNHQVILAFDTGYLMSGEIDGLARIDHAINSGLVLAYRTLRAGDRVGMIAFDSKVRDFVAPTSGPQALSLIRDRLARLEYSPEETNFTLGLSTLLGRLNRRSLVIVFTDFVDSITAQIMTENLRRVARHHVVLFVTLRDIALENLFETRPEKFQDVAEAVVAKDFLNERAGLYTRLRNLGIHTLETPSAALAGKLVGQYLFIKQRELI